MKDKNILTPKQELFCLEYLKDFNATQSYKRAGYKVKTDKVASTLSLRLLAKVVIKQRIDELKAKLTEKIEISVDWVLKGIKSIGDKIDAKDTDKLKAFELGGKYQKMFTEKIELSGEIKTIQELVTKVAGGTATPAETETLDKLKEG